MTTEINPKGYSNRSNAKRAIKAQTGPWTYKITANEDGRFYVAIDATVDPVQVPAVVDPEAAAIVQAVEAAIKPLAAKAWAKHPNNPSNKASDPLGMMSTLEALREGRLPAPRKPAAQPKESAKAKHAARKAAAKPATMAVDGSVHDHKVHGLTNCPHCKIHLSNGVGEHNQDVNGKKIKHKEFRYACLGCGTEFGPAVRKHKSRGTVVQGRNQGGYTIQKQRAQRNGVREYSPGTIGFKLWELCDALAKKLGGVAKVLPQQLKDAANKAGLNGTSAGIAFYQWRRFNGVMGRVELKKAKAK